MQRLSRITSSPKLGHSTKVISGLDLNFWVEKEGIFGEKGPLVTVWYIRKAELFRLKNEIIG
jgi:hypothetical protein